MGICLLLAGAVSAAVFFAVQRGQGRTSEGDLPDGLMVRFNHLVYTLGTPQSLAEAERLLKEALKTHPHKDRVYTALGRLEMQRAQRSATLMLSNLRPSAKAQLLFNQALKINPGNILALGGLASYHELHDDPQKALVLIDKITAIDPKNRPALQRKGRCLLMLKRHGEAEKVLLEALQAARRANDVKSQVAIREILGKAYLKQGKYARAERILVKAMEQAEAAKVVSCPYAALGELYSITGRRDKEAKIHIRAARMEPQKPLMQYHAARVLHQKGRYEEALRFIRRAIKLYDEPRSRSLRDLILAQLKPHPPAEEFNTALVDFNDGHYHRSRVHIDRALAASDRDAFMVLKGFILLLEKKYTEAEKLFSRVGTKDQPHTGARIGLGHINIVRKSYEAARLLLEPGVKEGQASFGEPGGRVDLNGYPWLTYRMACLGMGWVSANTSSHPAAITYFDRVLAHNPGDTFALLGKGNSLNALGRLEGAEKHLKQVLALAPGNRYALAELALVKYNRGQDAEAEKLFLAALRVGGRKYTCPHEGLGLIFLRAGKLQEAKDSFRRAIKINPKIEYKKFNGLARILIREGKIKKARELLHQSIRNYPYDGEARKLLASIKEK